MFFKKQQQEFKLKKPIKHIAFIMDGNGRWAKKRLLPRHLGHKEGCKRIIEIMETCGELGVKVMTLYAFSTENWKRPKDEIDHLFNYLEEFFNEGIEKMIARGVSVHVMGDISKLPAKTQETVYNAIDATKNCKNHVFNICLNYGGRDEIIKASQKFARDAIDGKRKIEDLDENMFATYLMSSGLPEVDLMIRTSGEQRISNYLLWQVAYAEFVFTKTPWPAFTKEEFYKCLREYESRNRRYGGISNE